MIIIVIIITTISTIWCNQDRKGTYYLHLKCISGTLMIYVFVRIIMARARGLLKVPNMTSITIFNESEGKIIGVCTTHQDPRGGLNRLPLHTKWSDDDYDYYREIFFMWPIIPRLHQISHNWTSKPTRVSRMFWRFFVSCTRLKLGKLVMDKITRVIWYCGFQDLHLPI